MLAESSLNISLLASAPFSLWLSEELKKGGGGPTWCVLETLWHMSHLPTLPFALLCVAL